VTEREPLILQTDRGYSIIRDTPDLADDVGPLRTRGDVRRALERMRLLFEVADADGNA